MQKFQSKSTHHIALWIAVTLLLVSYFFAVRGISYDVIRYDEQTSLGHIGALDMTGLSLLDTIQSLQDTSAQHPPLYFLLANLWGRFTSYHVFSVRLLSVLFGVLTLAVVFRLATDIGGQLVGIYTLLMMSTSIVFVFYMHDIRQYILLLLCVSIMWLMYERLCRSTTPLKKSHLFVLMLGALGAVYTHYSAIFALVPIGVYHLLFVRKDKAWWHISITMIIAGVLFMPWMPTALTGLGITAEKISSGDQKFLTNPMLAELTAQYWGNGQAELFIVIVILSLLAVLSNLRGSRYALFFAVTVPLTAIALNQTLEFIKWIRYVIVFCIYLSVFMGFGLALLHRQRFLLLFIPVIIGAWVFVGTNFQTSEDFYDQTQTTVPNNYFVELNYLVPLLKEVADSDDSILVPVIFHYGMTRESKQGKTSVEDYYLAETNIPYINLYSGRLARNPFDLDTLTQTVRDYSTIWLTYPIHDMYHIREFLKVIADDYTICQTINYGERSVLEQHVLTNQFDTSCIVD